MTMSAKAIAISPLCVRLRYIIDRSRARKSSLPGLAILSFRALFSCELYGVKDCGGSANRKENQCYEQQYAMNF